jgi:hypothetical protein
MVAQSGAGLKASDLVAWVRYDDGFTPECSLDRLRSAVSGSVPRRQVRSRHGQAHYSGSHASATVGRFLVHESQLELEVLESIRGSQPDNVGRAWSLRRRSGPGNAGGTASSSWALGLRWRDERRGFAG